ncbi:MAG: hypothetical protein OEY77_08395, partial [Nitrospira sp.]|nr:hypothetical protein [Nitrospira sp.]
MNRFRSIRIGVIADTHGIFNPAIRKCSITSIGLFSLARIIHDSAKKKSHRGSTLCYRSGDQATSTGSDG